jgi:cytochrome P450
MKAFDYSLIGLGLRLLSGPFLPLFWFDPTWKKAYTKVHQFVDKNIRIALERRQKMAETGNDPDDQKARKPYILLNQMVQSTQDPSYLRAHIINIFFPARDTAAYAFSNVMFELARHPQWWDELRTEVLQLGDANLTFELLKSLPVAKALLSESLRLHMPATRLSRSALKDTILPEGGGKDQRSPLFVPKGTYIEMDVYSLHRDSNIWGDDALEFKPSRWAKGRPLWEARWEYLPFGGGIRMCPAQQMALAQVTYLLVRMAQGFKAIINRDDVFEYVEEIKMTISCRNGVKISLVPA